MLNIQNAIKAYKIDPDIDQADALEYVKTAGGGVFTIILTYVYCIAVIIAPLCTVGALAILVRKPASYVRSLLSQRGKKRILLIGEGAYNKHCYSCIPQIILIFISFHSVLVSSHFSFIIINIVLVLGLLYLLYNFGCFFTILI